MWKSLPSKHVLEIVRQMTIHNGSKQIISPSGGFELLYVPLNFPSSSEIIKWMFSPHTKTRDTKDNIWYLKSCTDVDKTNIRYLKFCSDVDRGLPNFIAGYQDATVFTLID